MSNDFITVTRTLVKRGWTDIEPKIAVGFATGTFAAIAINIVRAYGIDIPPTIEPYVPYLFAMIGGYIAPSAGTTVMKTETLPTGRKQETETHSAPTVSTFTAPTAVQTASASESTPVESIPVANRYEHILKNLGNTGAIPEDQKATEILPSTGWQN